MSVEIKTRKEKDATVLTVSGRLILQDGSKLHDEVKRLAEAGVRRLVIDLSGLQYLDSWGMGQMVASQTTLRAQGGKLRYAGIPEKIMAILSISSVPRILEFDPDVAASLAKLSGS